MNGQDVSNSSHEDAVRCFQLAQEPIIVEVLRRQPVQQQQQQQHGQRAGWKEQEVRGTEPEKESERTIEAGGKRENAINTCTNLVSTAVQTDWAGLLEAEEEELLPVVDEQPNDSFEDFLAHDIDFEVTPPANLRNQRRDSGREVESEKTSPFRKQTTRFASILDPSSLRKSCIFPKKKNRLSFGEIFIFCIVLFVRRIFSSK